MVDSLQRIIEAKRWKWLVDHKRENHLNSEREIIDGEKKWTDAELESSMMIEVLKANLRNENNSSAENSL